MSDEIGMGSFNLSPIDPSRDSLPAALDLSHYGNLPIHVRLELTRRILAAQVHYRAMEEECEVMGVSEAAYVQGYLLALPPITHTTGGSLVGQTHDRKCMLDECGEESK